MERGEIAEEGSHAELVTQAGGHIRPPQRIAIGQRMSFRYRIGAYVGLLRHYGETFHYHWKNRRQTGSGLFKDDEAEFLPPALSLQEKPVSPVVRLTAKVLIALVVTLLLWSIFGRMDIIVNAVGKIIPSERTKTIASVDVASVKALHVQEGQTVKAGRCAGRAGRNRL